VLPALAVADALRSHGAQVSFLTDKASRVPASAGYEVDLLRVAGLPRRPGAKLVRALAAAAAAVPASVRVLRRRRPDVVLGGGGYVAGPVVLAAGLLRIPAATMEADAHLGLANRLSGPFARRVFCAFPIEGVDSSKYQVVGRPIPARSRVTERAAARRLFELPEEGAVVLVFGGSQGAWGLNEAAFKAFGRDGPAVLHLCGTRDHEALARRVSRPDYRLVAYTEDFGAALAAADLVVARAGGSVWEVAAAGKPALLVPYPYATSEHQTKNARYFERNGGAVVVPESELDLRRQVEALLADPDRLAAMGEAMRSLARPDAAERVAEELIALASA
jgi:UDP-N-acetylglucosamine--N-acetylmuramyl-(pentapeptide) pyrophosphoryl-undecaprenol N-acetylglucosamine transferase